jgi:hypothetical protein
VGGLPREGSEGSCCFGRLTAGLEVVAEAESAEAFAAETTDASGNSDEASEKEDHVEEFKGHYGISFLRVLGCYR